MDKSGGIDVQQLARVVGQLAEVVDRIPQPSTENRSESTINLNAGGIGVWIATCACAMMMGIGLVLTALVINHNRKIDDMSHYLQAIYTQAPHLKPKDD